MAALREQKWHEETLKVGQWLRVCARSDLCCRRNKPPGNELQMLRLSHVRSQVDRMRLPSRQIAPCPLLLKVRCSSLLVVRIH
jgi:hypothetical protein